MVNRLGKIQVYLDQGEKLLHSDSMFSVVPWTQLSGVDNKSITSSIKRYCTLSRKEMEYLSGKVTLKYLLAILNSSTANRLLEEQRGGDYHIYPEHLRQIPIPIPDMTVQNEIAGRIDLLLTAIMQNDDASRIRIQKDIDTVVDALYQSN